MSAIVNLGLERRTEHTMSDPRVVIVTFPRQRSSTSQGLEDFPSASRFLPTVRYRTQAVSSRDDGAVMVSRGLEFATTSTSTASIRAPVATLVVAGAEDRRADEALLLHVRRLARSAARHLAKRSAGGRIRRSDREQSCALATSLRTQNHRVDHEWPYGTATQAGGTCGSAAPIALNADPVEEHIKHALRCLQGGSSP